MKLNVLGGSGSGTTTLAAALGSRRGWVHLDVDDFFWVPTDPPYREKVAAGVREQTLREAFEAGPDVVVSGSLVSFDPYWRRAFDLHVFLGLPPALRLQRLRDRERARFGGRLDGELAEHSAEFVAWAARYDDPSFTGRSRAVHEAWLATVRGAVLWLEGDLTVDARVDAVLDATSELQGPSST